MERFIDAFIDLEKPLIAVVNGHAVGILVTTLGLCDFVIATNDATFHAPFGSTAQTPEGCSSYTFPRILGTSVANKMLLFNYKLTAQEALTHGLIGKLHSKFGELHFAIQTNQKQTQITSVRLIELPFQQVKWSRNRI